jgi:hypothetical protein
MIIGVDSRAPKLFFKGKKRRLRAWQIEEMPKYTLPCCSGEWEKTLFFF